MTVRSISGAISLALLMPLGCGEPEAGSSASPPGPVEEELRDSTGKPVGHISRAIMMLNAETDRKLGLVARLEVKPNELIEFYEPTPGVLMTSFAGAPASSMLMLGERPSGPEELWQMAADGAPMPASLAAAIGRAKARQAGTSAPATDQAPGWGGGNAALPPNAAAGPANDARRGELLSSAESRFDGENIVRERSALLNVNAQSGYCDDTYLEQMRTNPCPSHPLFSWYLCKENWWNGLYAYHHDSLQMYANVCPATGPVTMRVENEDVNINPTFIPVPTNTVRGTQWWDRHCSYAWNDCPYIRVDIIDAAGDRFHFRMEVDEE